MTWLLWRQHRLQAAVAVIGLAAFSVLIAVTGVHMAHLYRDAVLRCHDCLLVGSLFQGYGAVVDIVSLTVAVPVIIGLVFGATLIARETEQSTNVLAWTQTISRRRWVLTKVVAALVATLVCTAVLSALVTWWSGTINSLYGNRFDPLKFDAQNLMPVAFGVFALGAGLAAGALLRRTLPAIAVTLGAFLAARLLVEIYLRPHYQAAMSILTVPGGGDAVPSGAWVLNSTLIGPDHHPIPGAIDPKSICPTAVDRVSAADCLNRLGYRIKISFQPAARYWHFQWTEATIFTLAGLALLVTAVVLTLRRDA